MKNLVLVLLALLAVPAFAEPIITATESGGVVTIGYDANGTDLVSGMGIVVTLSDGTIKTGTFQDLSTDYWVHPTNFQYDDINDIVTEGSPIYAGGEGSATITVEYGALYDGEANAPAESGDLFSFEIDGASGDVTVDAISSHAGGLVTESLAAYDNLTAQVTVGGSSACFTGTAAEVALWNSYGQPSTWCNPGWRTGDVNGDTYTTFGDVIFVFDDFKAADATGRSDVNMDGYLTFGDIIAVFDLFKNQ